MENEMTNDAAVAWMGPNGHLIDNARFQSRVDGMPDFGDLSRYQPLVPATIVAELRAEVGRLQALSAAISRDCNECANQRNEANAKAAAAERRVAELLQAVREVHIAESDVRIHEAMNPRSRNYRLPIYEAQRQARERLSALTKDRHDRH